MNAECIADCLLTHMLVRFCQVTCADSLCSLKVRTEMMYLSW
jgi:hypothetical protein